MRDVVNFSPWSDRAAAAKALCSMITAGLLPASGGTVSIDGKLVARPRTEIGIVFQSPVLLEWRTALGNVMLQAEAKKLERAAAERRARKLLDAVGLADSSKNTRTSSRAACASGSRSVERSFMNPITL